MSQAALRQRRRSIRVSPASQAPTGPGSLSHRHPLAPLKRRLQPTRRAASTSRQRPRILVIEDDRYAREALVLLLDFYGYEVASASNGSEALALVNDAAPDLVVTDWRMPGLSGLALCQALRHRRQTMPIVVVTSADEVFLHDHPVNARLRKPVDPPLLNRVILDELLHARRG